ncbi:MAG: hypothetical protein ACK521_11210 [bacterium]
MHHPNTLSPRINDTQSKYHEYSRQLTPVESYGDESLVHMKT